MTDRSFLDTNVLVYLFDASAPAKQARARELFEREVGEGRAVLSAQVLGEFFVTITRKLDPTVDADSAERALARLSRLPTVAIDGDLIIAAVAVARAERLSFRDSLVLRAAISGGCSRVLTEDLQHGRKYGSVRIENPFRGL